MPRFFQLIYAENGCGMPKFCTLSSKHSFFSKKARILRKVVIDTTDSLAKGVSCRQPTAVPLRQKIPPAKREQKQKRAGSQRNQLPKSLPKTQNTTNEVNGYRPEYVLTSSLRTPKIFIKEFGDFLMSCHQHCLGVNLLVQR